ncbi:MAG: hypothetical protein HQ567_11425 [Candidatus Nealsonbacteria bacterium]|nr:hypothetical protein [Candidatus Nealsonbacteria bacterium]
MRRRKLEFGVLVVAALASAVFLQAGRVSGAEPPEKLPPLDEVERIVQKHFASLRKYRDGDIIARGDVKPIFTQLEAIGWKVADRADILSAVMADGSFLVRNLRTANGRKFMQQIASYPDGYDRTDRLSKLPRGQQTVLDLINKPGGAKMIEYMTTAPGGKNLGKQLSRGPKGRNFNELTGRIYTAKALLVRLKESYQEAVKAAGTVKAGK